MASLDSNFIFAKRERKAMLINSATRVASGDGSGLVKEKWKCKRRAYSKTGV
jgi:hypothetical protein